MADTYVIFPPEEFWTFVTYKNPKPTVMPGSEFVNWHSVYGDGHIKGVVTLKTVNEGGAKLFLYEEDTGQLVDATTTDAAGNFRFNDLNTAKKFYITVKEKSTMWEYRVQSRITPVI